MKHGFSSALAIRPQSRLHRISRFLPRAIGGTPPYDVSPCKSHAEGQHTHLSSYARIMQGGGATRGGGNVGTNGHEKVVQL